MWLVDVPSVISTQRSQSIAWITTFKEFRFAIRALLHLFKFGANAFDYYIKTYIYIYPNPRLQVFQEKTPDLLIQKAPPEPCDKNPPGLLDGQEGKATAELKFTVVLTSSVQANPAEG